MLHESHHSQHGRGREPEPEQEEAKHGRVTVAALCDGAVSAWSLEPGARQEGGVDVPVREV
jgi:hypothetical protein